MASVSSPITPPASRPQSFGRRVAAKVSSLIAKFEAMSAPPVPPRSPPRKRTLASVVASGSSFSRRANIRKAVSRKASRIFAKLEREDENDSMPPLKIPPPPKRILRASRATNSHKGRRATMPVETPKEYPAKKRRTLSESLHDQINIEDENSGITLDGPISRFASEWSTGCTSLSSLVYSTPPVAKVLPSSFFSQLVVSEPRPVKTPKPKVMTDSEDSQLLIVEKREKIDPRRFRLNSLDRRQSVWRRKITPPKISVKDLISRFREEAVEAKYTEAATQTSSPHIHRITETSEASSGKDDFHSIVVLSDSLDSPRDIIGPENLHFAQYFNNSTDSRVISQKSGSNGSQGEAIFHPGNYASPVVCLTSPFAASKAISQQASIRLVTSAEENDGLIMPTISSVGITQKPDHDINKPTPYTAPTRLDTPPLQSLKRYRKTPPPEGFFRAKVRRPRYSAAPSLYTLTDESEEMFPRSELSSTIRTSHSTSTDSSNSYYISSSSGSSSRAGRIAISSRTGGIMISTGIPAASIVTPVPVNAVTTVAIRALVSRVPEFGGLKL